MFILSRKYGRLCNRLFNAAHIMAFAIEHNHTFVNLSFYDYAEHYDSTRNDLFCRYPAVPGLFKSNKFLATILYQCNLYLSYFILYLRKMGIRTDRLGLTTIKAPGMKYGTPLIHMASLPLDPSRSSQIVFFQGFHLRAFDDLKKHGDKVREYFRPVEKYRTHVSDFIRENRKGCDVLAGIVVRHGDYRTWKDGRHFYPVEAYAELMSQLAVLLPGRKVRFLVFSDEEQDQEVFRNAGLDFRFRSGHMMENLYSLAECDYIISPPSTYGLWASFYGKTPIYIVDDPTLPLSLTESFEICEG